MSVADEIRRLSRTGLNTGEIARHLGIRYQHAYNVLKRSGLITTLDPSLKAPAQIVQKPPLTVETLIGCGFTYACCWRLTEQGELSFDRAPPKEVGVYAFAKGGAVLYVGVATMGLAKRLYFYSRPGVTQKTSLRLNSIIKDELKAAADVDIYTAFPPDFEWNGLPIHGSAGLELGLIKKFTLPWNLRSAKGI
jgi:hypothetical protein